MLPGHAEPGWAPRPPRVNPRWRVIAARDSPAIDPSCQLAGRPSDESVNEHRGAAGPDTQTCTPTDGRAAASRPRYTLQGPARPCRSRSPLLARVRPFVIGGDQVMAGRHGPAAGDLHQSHPLRGLTFIEDFIWAGVSPARPTRTPSPATRTCNYRLPQDAGIIATRWAVAETVVIVAGSGCTGASDTLVPSWDCGFPRAWSTDTTSAPRRSTNRPLHRLLEHHCNELP